jgi:hypothetical protein
MLLTSRDVVATEKKVAKPENKVAEVVEPREEVHFGSSLPLSAPPPISKVLHDVYQDETRANN